MIIKSDWNNMPLDHTTFSKPSVDVIPSQAYDPVDPSHTMYDIYVFRFGYLDSSLVSLRGLDSELEWLTIDGIPSMDYGRTFKTIHGTEFPNKDPHVYYEGPVNDSHPLLVPELTYYSNAGILEGTLICRTKARATIYDGEKDTGTLIEDVTFTAQSSQMPSKIMFSPVKLFCEANADGTPKIGTSLWVTLLPTAVNELGVLEGEKIYPDVTDKTRYYELVHDENNLVTEYKLVEPPKPINPGGKSMRIVWDKIGERFFETGLDHGVMFPQAITGDYEKGVAWNGLTAVTENPTGAESNPQYADNIKYFELTTTEEFGATLEAFTFPPEFAPCNGYAEPVKGMRIGQQSRRAFGLAYRTLKGNDVYGQDYGYIIHLVYGCKVTPTSRNYNTNSDTPEPVALSWELTTTPVTVTGYKPTATVEFDSTIYSATIMSKIEDIIYGTDTDEPRLPMPDELKTLIAEELAKEPTESSVTPLMSKRATAPAGSETTVEG